MNFLNNSMPLLGTGAVMTAVIGFWSYAKNIGSRIFTLFIETGDVTGDISRTLSYHCLNNMKRVKWGPRSFTESLLYVKPKQHVHTVIFEEFNTSVTLFFEGWRPFLIRKKGKSSSSSSEVATTSSNSLDLSVVFYYIKGTFNIEKILLDSVDKTSALLSGEISTNSSRHFISRQFGKSGNSYSGGHGVEPMGQKLPIERGFLETLSSIPLRYKLSELGYSDKVKAFSNLFYPPELETHILEVERWVNSKNWFLSRKIPHRLGWLLNGLPGTGKSSLVKAIAQRFDLPVFTFDLSSMANSDFTSSWSSAVAYGPSIVLLEDFDNVFHGRENITKGAMTRDLLSFDCLLNCISGVENSDGIFLIITVNDPSKVDSAIGICDNAGNSSRPGRIDRVITLTNTTADTRKLIAANMLKDVESDDNILELVDSSDGDTPAQFQNKCVALALKLFWKNKDV